MHGRHVLQFLINPSLVSVRIKASKTNPFRKGVTIHLGCTGGRLYPVSALAAYHVVRGMKPGPFFVFKDGSHSLGKS